MQILGFEISKKKKPVEVESNSIGDYHGGHRAYRKRYNPIHYGTFDGEKTPGELGDLYHLDTDSEALRIRAYEADLTNDVISIITGKFFKWVIGTGLKLQAEPNAIVLDTEGIKFEPNDFSEKVEARFDVFANDKISDYSEMDCLHEKARQAFKAAFFGDCLVVLRVKNGYPTIQVIDGEHVQTPYLDGSHKFISEAEGRGNTIRNGIEIDSKGKHIAFYVLKEKKGEYLLGEFERIEAEGGRSNRKMAWLFNLKKHRIGSDRGIPVITPILEKVTKLDRYTESTVAGAEERAKIAYSIEHNQFSDGESPLMAGYKAAIGKGQETAKETNNYELGEDTALKIAATTSKQTFNMPIGSSLKALYSQSEIQFEPFWRAIFNSLCASVDIPPEVALQMYNSNYSASRAAINSWGHILNIYRDIVTKNFYQPFYDLWLETEILRGKIKAEGYLKHLENFMVKNAFSKARFTGQNMPHIDPVKEVKALVAALESGLISHEQATEALNMGDWKANFRKLLEENKIKPSKESKQEDNVINKKSNKE